MSMIFDNSNSDNPITAINETHDAFRKQIRKHCSGTVMHLRWIKNLNFEKALKEYEKILRENKLWDNWERLLIKMENEVKSTYGKVCDEWMLEALSDFNLKTEIRNGFRFEWDLIGKKPKGIF